MKKAYDILANAISHLRKSISVKHVLILIECPFVALCLKTFCNAKCTFVIKKVTFEALSDFDFVVYENLYERGYRNTFDLVLTDQDYLERDDRLNFMTAGGRAFNCVRGVYTYMRGNS